MEVGSCGRRLACECGMLRSRGAGFDGGGLPAVGDTLVVGSCTCCDELDSGTSASSGEFRVYTDASESTDPLLYSSTPTSFPFSGLPKSKYPAPFPNIGGLLGLTGLRKSDLPESVRPRGIGGTRSSGVMAEDTVNCDARLPWWNPEYVEYREYR